MQDMEMKSVLRDQRVDVMESRLERQERIAAELEKRMGQIDDPVQRLARKNGAD